MNLLAPLSWEELQGLSYLRARLCLIDKDFIYHMLNLIDEKMIVMTTALIKEASASMFNNLNTLATAEHSPIYISSVCSETTLRLTQSKIITLSSEVNYLNQAYLLQYFFRASTAKPNYINYARAEVTLIPYSQSLELLRGKTNIYYLHARARAQPEAHLELRAQALECLTSFLILNLELATTSINSIFKAFMFEKIRTSLMHTSVHQELGQLVYNIQLFLDRQVLGQNIPLCSRGTATQSIAKI